MRIIQMSFKCPLVFHQPLIASGEHPTFWSRGELCPGPTKKPRLESLFVPSCAESRCRLSSCEVNGTPSPDVRPQLRQMNLFDHQMWATPMITKSVVAWKIFRLDSTLQ